MLDFNEKYIWVQQQGKIKVFETATIAEQTDFSKPRWTFPVNDIRHIFLTDASHNFFWTEGVKGMLKFSPQCNRFRHFLPGDIVHGILHETPDGLFF